MQYNIKKLLAIMYLRTYKDKYQYSELKDLLGLSITQLKEFINNLIDDDLIINSSSLHLTNKSIGILESIGLIDVNINTLIKDKASISTNSDKLTLEDVYIPENFKL